MLQGQASATVRAVTQGFPEGGAAPPGLVLPATSQVLLKVLLCPTDGTHTHHFHPTVRRVRAHAPHHTVLTLSLHLSLPTILLGPKGQAFFSLPSTFHPLGLTAQS